MLFIPMKWIPWLLLIGGVALLFEGEIAGGIIASILGGGWLLLKNRS